MAKRFLIQTKMAFDSAQSMQSIELTPSVSTFVNSLDLKLTNKSNLALINGVFSLGIESLTLIALQKISATISIYRDEAQTDLAYSVVQTLAVGAAALVIPSVDYVIPIQFVENPVIRGSEDTATYYISITIDAVGVTLLPGNVSLNKYSITAQEISE
ncbi:hypothetical protein J2Z44_003858 [Clostridium punense]|uniref:Uncharacterized protein n=1 Tax=Clostridium punense TaxID=1054297 RepID=A0ABS4K8C1_9CLOT|nr:MULTISPECIES: hypothetical protein [Clostridium]EQB89627.1 hypothetical protein M918_19740 [Clostridium sp. BL8]MBP2024008.1 hypothetical protein [Clostridium punense]